MRFLAMVCVMCVMSGLTGFAQQVDHVLYLVGDAGEPVIETSPLGKTLQSSIEGERTPVTLVYLGDNVYPKGVPPLKFKSRPEAEKILYIQAGWLGDNQQAKGIFVPGNHDWKKGTKQGWAHITNQQAFIDSLGDRRIQFIPEDGCPGPVELMLTNHVVLVIIDSQWLLHPWEKPGEESSCDASTATGLATMLEDVYARHADKRVILAAHHPAITYGIHGGVSGIKDHLFPLTEVHDNLYIPLPVVGSLYPFYRKFLGDIQDVRHPLYYTYARTVREIMAAYPGSMMVSGHEHALQYSRVDDAHFIVSGSGSKTTFVKKKGYARYAEPVTGFVKLLLMADGQVKMEFIRVDHEFPQGTIAYAETLPVPDRMVLPDTISIEKGGKSAIEVKASNRYAAGPGKQRWLGANYRAAWSQPVTAPYFNFMSEHGPLEPVKKGGGMQTLSLRMRDSTGREYTLRSVEKYPEKAVPEPLRKTFAQDLVQDQISAAHPYGALIIPPLAEAAGIYHTNPKLVYLPDDSRLGIYRSVFAGRLMLFEEHADGDWSDKPFFGNSDDIINTSKTLKKLEKDNDNQVDQYFVLRSRLFDMIIGDWDRHDDQWRWARFEEGKQEQYRPIPRDRDQAFFVNEGILPRLWSRKWALPKFEGFNHTIRWPSGLSFNARYFDRSFLAGLSMDDWIEEARTLQQSITDEVIDSAVRTWPEPICQLDGDDIAQKLKSRRDKVMEYALSHYKFLAREVDITGSDKRERFEVTRLDSGHVRVDVFKLSKEGEKKQRFYHRVFRYHETSEIRLYGRGGDDQFDVKGEVSRSILVRIIGGGGDDQLHDESDVSGWNKKTWLYDEPANTIVQSSGEVKDLTSDDETVNDYDRMAFQYDRLAPLLYGNFNPDDGLFIGGGLLYQNHGFRKEPFRQRHIIVASVAPRTNSYNLLYRGDFTGILGRWDGHLNADVKEPNFVNNFFGWGNESVFDQEIDEQPSIRADDAIDYYWFRFEEIKVEATVSRKVGAIGEISFGPAYQRIEIEEPDDSDRYVYDFAATLPYNLFSEFNSYAGGLWSFGASKKDNALLTTRGMEFTLGGRTMTSVGGDNRHTFTAMNGSLSLYYALRQQGRLTFAVRAGGGINTGRYEFYQAQILDGKTELRGYRKTRFYGDSKFFTNLEARLKIASIRSYLFPASLGILGFHDIGRVWYEDENGIDPTAPTGTSGVWHKGWGGGLWFTPFNLTVLSAELGHSTEGNMFYLRLGFLF